MDTTSDAHRKTLVTLIAIVLIAAVVTASVAAAPRKSKPAAMPSTTTATASSTVNTSTAASGSSTTAASGFKDGTYSASGSYESPGGDETISVTVTLKSGVITSTSAQSGAQDPEAEEYQQDFLSGYKHLVVGKSIDSVSLSRVSGSSLTSQGFNEAISQIKTEAAA